MKEHNILSQSFKIRQPNKFITITFTDGTPPYKTLTKWMRSIARKARKQEHYDHYYQIELSEEDTFHIHLLAITQLKAAVMRSLIKKSIAEETTVYVKQVRNAEYLAHYICKDMEGHAGVMFPESYRGRGKRLTNWSKGFLAASRATLWEQAKQSWKQSQLKENHVDTSKVNQLPTDDSQSTPNPIEEPIYE